jgi:hypothetical protein
VSDLKQLDDYCDYLDEMQRDLDFSQITDPGPAIPISASQGTYRNTRKGWLAAAAAAVAVLVLVGGMAALARIQQESQIAPVAEDPTPIETDTPVPETITPEEDPIAEPAEPPVIVEAETNAPRLAINVPSGVESGTIDTPLGPARWVHLPYDGPTPHNASAVPWPSGFAVFSGPTYNFDPLIRDPSSDDPSRIPPALWVSDDGIEWSTIPLPAVTATAGQARLEHVDGVYWLTSQDPDGEWHRWRSPDAANWDELEVSRLGPEPGSLYGGPDMSTPASTGDVTVMQARFDARFPITEFVVGASDGECDGQVSLHRLGLDRFRVAKAVGEGEGPYCPPQPVLRMVETETGLDVLVDETDEKLGVIEGASLDDMDLVVGDDLGDAERLLVVRDGEITSIELPWSTIRDATLVGTGDFVYAYVSDWAHNGGHPAVWRTENGTTWTDLGPVDLPGEPGDNSDFEFVAFADGRLGAWNRDTPDEAWETVDGVNWQKAEFGPSPEDLTANSNGYEAISRPTASRWILDNGVGLWIDFNGEWASLADLDLPEASGYWHRWTSGFGHTTYIVTDEFVFRGDGAFLAYSLWIVNLEPTE